MNKSIVIRVGAFPQKSETFITQQAIIAIELGYNVRLLVNKKNNLKDSSQAELINQYNLLEKTFEIPKYNIPDLFRRFVCIAKLLFSKPSLKKVYALNFFKYGLDALKGKLLIQYSQIEEFLSADIFHIQFGVNKEPIESLKRHGFIGAKVITTFHGFDVHFTKETFSDKRVFYKKLFSMGELFTANTKYLAEQLYQLGCPKERLEIIPVPVDTSFFIQNDKESSEAIKITSVGRLIRWKGHKYGILAINELVNRGIENISYTIIGEGEEHENLKNLINELKLQECISLSGPRSQDEIKLDLQKSDIFLMTSTYDETGRRETQGVVTGEAQACGLPVIAFRSGGVPYTINEGETGLLCGENDFIGLADNLEKIIIDEKLRLEMGKKARSFIENEYSLGSAKIKWSMVYETY